MVGSRSTGSSSSGGYASSPSTIRSSPSRGSVVYGGSNRTGRSSGTSVPSQTYTPNYDWNWSYWNDTNWFIYRLMNRYYFLNGYEYLWRYRQGDSPLTQESMRVALQECVSASAGMLRLSEQLENITNRYEAGEIEEDEFKNLVKDKTDQVRKLAKTIRKDDFLDYIDQRQNDYDGSFQEAQSVRGLKALTQQLRMMAYEIDTGLEAFNEEDMTRVVNVRELERPSFDSLSKGIDRLAKTIERSAKSL